MWSDGTLMCSYHGWRFKQDGACTSIPQVGISPAPLPARFPTPPRYPAHGRLLGGQAFWATPVWPPLVPAGGCPTQLHV